MEEWKKVKIGDVLELKQGLAINSKTKHFVSQKKTSLPLLRITDMQEGNMKVFMNETIPERYISKPTDIIYTRTGKVGLVFTNQRGVVHNNCFRVIPKDSDLIDMKFLYWLLKQKRVYEVANSIAVGSAQPDLSHDSFKGIEIYLPPLATQKKIAEVLSSLDDKIELNNKINANLEQQAQAIFKSWFVDFEPFGGEMPAGWKVGKLGEFTEIKRGGSPRPIQNFMADEGLRWLKISDVTSLSSPFVLRIAEHIKEEGLSKTVFLKAGSLVLSNSATPGIPKIVDLDTCIHDGWLYFPKSQLSNEYLYLLFKEIRPKLVSLGNGSIFTNLKTDILKNYEVCLPSTDVLEKFQSIVEPIFKQMLSIQREIKQIETIRDSLLPKLMNGEIEI